MNEPYIYMENASEDLQWTFSLATYSSLVSVQEDQEYGGKIFLSSDWNTNVEHVAMVLHFPESIPAVLI
jgi:hypothetical protein